MNLLGARGSGGIVREIKWEVRDWREEKKESFISVKQYTMRERGKEKEKEENEEVKDKEKNKRKSSRKTGKWKSANVLGWHDYFF